MKKDPYKHEQRYFEWKESVKEGIQNLSRANSELITTYVTDMEKGINVSASSVKGSRSYARLNTLRGRLMFFANKFKELYDIDDITKIKEDQLVEFFSDMQKGKIKKTNGKIFMSISTYTKIYKSFWHWWMKVNRKKGINIQDITIDIDIREDKPSWVYLTEEQVKRLCENAKHEYRVLITFLFDSGIRAPSELMNIKVSDLYNDYKELNIRDEISKTFGRRIKLMICSNLLKEYVESKKLTKEDYIFQTRPFVINKYLRRLAEKLFGDKKSPAGQKYSELTMYDFRHISTCYWLPRYKSESALKFRFGWKKSDKIHYYSEMLGMRDTITEDDLLIDVTKTEIEKRLTKSENEKTMLQERVQLLEGQMKEILELSQYARNVA